MREEKEPFYFFGNVPKFFHVEKYVRENSIITKLIQAQNVLLFVFLGTVPKNHYSKWGTVLQRLNFEKESRDPEIKKRPGNGSSMPGFIANESRGLALTLSLYTISIWKSNKVEGRFPDCVCSKWKRGV